MIRVSLPAKPEDFDTKVKNPGLNFLKRTPSPSAGEWRRNDYWRRAHDDLYRDHAGICVYCASWTPRRAHKTTRIDHTSVDHFVPKSLDARGAYEWENFRLCRTRLNNNKGDHTDVLDPCKISNGFFMLDFTTFRIEPSPDVSPGIEGKVRATISRLRLNSDTDYVNERIRVICDYVMRELSLNDVRERYPFIGAQIVLQDFDRQFSDRLERFLRRSVGGGA